MYSVSSPEAAGALPQYLLINLETNRRSKKQYFAYQLLPSSLDAAEEAEQEGSDDQGNMPVDESEQEEEAPAPPPRRTGRAYMPSAAALRQFAQAR